MKLFKEIKNAELRVQNGPLEMGGPDVWAALLRRPATQPRPGGALSYFELFRPKNIYGDVTAKKRQFIVIFYKRLSAVAKALADKVVRGLGRFWFRSVKLASSYFKVGQDSIWPDWPLLLILAARQNGHLLLQCTLNMYGTQLKNMRRARCRKLALQFNSDRKNWQPFGLVCHRASGGVVPRSQNAGGYAPSSRLAIGPLPNPAPPSPVFELGSELSEPSILEGFS